VLHIQFSSVVDRGVYPLSDQTTVLLECGRSWSILSDQTTVLLECGRSWSILSDQTTVLLECGRSWSILSDQTTVLLECGRSWSILSDQTTVLLECGRLWIPYLTTKKFGFVASSLRGVRANNSRLRIRIITRVNVVSTYWMLLQSASTIEIQHSVLV
jgi:hypothetical protein